jgi:ATP-binding cassette subfamily B multidrug efflux pump
MRLVSLFEIVNHTLVVGLIHGLCGSALWLWTQGQVGTGAVAAVTAMALRISGMSHWIMWEMTSLFENIGTVQDGISTLTRPRAVVDAPGAQPRCAVPRGEVRFEQVRFATARAAR